MHNYIYTVPVEHTSGFSVRLHIHENAKGKLRDVI